MAVLVIPAAEVVIEGLITAGAWAYRAYRVYRAAKTLDTVVQAQEAAKTEEEAKEKARTAAQAKGDAAASADCKNCEPDPNCEKWKNEVNKALYEAKKPKGIGGDGDGGKGIAQRLCEWIHGTLPGGGKHEQSVKDEIRRINNNVEKLKNTKQFRCPSPANLVAEARLYTGQLADAFNGNLPHLPRADFKAFCYERAAALASKFLGK